jgi:hypothetical protein
VLLLFLKKLEGVVLVGPYVDFFVVVDAYSCLLFTLLLCCIHHLQRCCTWPVVHCVSLSDGMGLVTFFFGLKNRAWWDPLFFLSVFVE